MSLRAPASAPWPAASRPSLLVVDDEMPVLRLIERFADQAGFAVTTCSSGAEAMRLLTAKPTDLAMVDLRMPDVNGLELLRQTRRAVPGCEVILMTGHGSVESAVEAIKLGAREFLTKPFDFDRLRKVLTGIREELARRAQASALEHAVAREPEFCGMLGHSPAMQEVFSLIRRLAPHAKSVLLSGETGTGKDLAARAFHQIGPRQSKPFIIVNCSAVVPALFESDLADHVDAAQGGTLVLDEIGELPQSVQARLLRALEFGELQRAASPRAKPADVTVIAATNRDLRAEVAAGRFRGDLFYRLNAVEVQLPPLRARREDIPYLTAAFVAECAQQMGKAFTGLSPAAERLLLGAPWDGNVRELKHVVQRACMLSDGSLITEKEIVSSLGPSVAAGQSAQGRAPSALDDVERRHIIEILRQVHGNRVAAAKMLGISRRALYRRLERHRIGDIS